jgi:pyroglutamyl-peptidase
VKNNILLTSFDPFNKASLNQSQLVAKKLETLLEEDHQVTSMVLPTVYDQASQRIIDTLNQQKFQLVLSLGEGDHRTRYETRAYNLDDCESIPDNHGVIRVNKKIDDQDIEYFDMEKALQKFHLKIPKSQNLSVEISDSAGRFVCNNLCYIVANFCDAKKIPFLFFHVPKHTHSDDMKNPKFVAQNIFKFLREIGLANGG